MAEKLEAQHLHLVFQLSNSQNQVLFHIYILHNYVQIDTAF